MKKSFKSLCIIICIFLLIPSLAFAHSGRTDSNGGHKDNKNASGLGSYHYHHGTSPHLHDGGVCPYSTTSSQSSNSSSSTQTVTTPKKDTIVINNAPTTLNVGQSHELEYTIDFTGTQEYSIVSSDESIISVTDNIIKAVGEGTATITVKSTNNEKSFTLDVKVISVESITVEESIEIQLGKSGMITTNVVPDNATNKTLEFSSSNTEVVTVEGNAYNTISVGEADITTTAINGVTATTHIKVFEIEPNEINTNKESFEIEILNTDSISIEVLPTDANNLEFATKILDSDIIKIDDSGKITPLTEGETSIEITTWNGITKTIPVSIYSIPVGEVIIDDSQLVYKSNNEIDIDSELILSTTITPENATFPDITWHSSDESVIQINDNIPEIVGTGEAILTARAVSGAEATLSLNVTKDSPISGLVIIVILVLVIAGVVFVIVKKMKKNKEV